MVYTEIKERNGKRYYYRVLSVRKGDRISKKRKYLGLNLSKKELSKKEREADKNLVSTKKKPSDKELERIKSKIKEILKKNKVKRAGIFGSYARGEQKKNSDIDILVEINDKDMSLLGFVGIKIELEDNLGKKVDLVEYSEIKPQIKERVLKEQVKII